MASWYPTGRKLVMPGKSIRIKTISERPNFTCSDCQLGSLWPPGQPVFQTTTSTMARRDLQEIFRQPLKPENRESSHRITFTCTRGCTVDTVTLGVIRKKP